MPKVYEVDNPDNFASCAPIAFELPPFSDLEKYYLKYGIDYPNGGITSQEFANIVGGKVKFNIDLYEKRVRNNLSIQGFGNTCALRISHTLNENGHYLPSKPYQASSSSKKRWYIYRVMDLDKFLTNNYEEADVIVNKTSSKPISDLNFLGKKGIIIFDTRGTWTDATGHATLWNGQKRLGGNYESDFYFEKSKTVKLWIAK